MGKEDILESRANLQKQDLWEEDIRANLVKLEHTRVNLAREEEFKLDIQTSQLATLVNQLVTPVSHQLTLVNQLVILTSLLPILHNQEDILQQMLSILFQGACHTQPNLLRGCLVYSTQQILIPLDPQLVKVAINNSIQANHHILLPVHHSHPQHLPSTLL